MPQLGLVEQRPPGLHSLPCIQQSFAHQNATPLCLKYVKETRNWIPFCCCWLPCSAEVTVQCTCSGDCLFTTFRCLLRFLSKRRKEDGEANQRQQVCQVLSAPSDAADKTWRAGWELWSCSTAKHCLQVAQPAAPPCAADKNQGDKAGEAADKFKELAQAYAILSDPEKKRKYDMGGFESLNPSDLEVQVDLSSLGELREASRGAGQLCYF